MVDLGVERGVPLDSKNGKQTGWVGSPHREFAHARLIRFPAADARGPSSSWILHLRGRGPARPSGYKAV
jgi:hypothetical protein